MKIEDIDIGTITLPRGHRTGTFSSNTAKGLQLKLKRVGRQVKKEWHHRYTRSDGSRTTLLIGHFPDVDYQEAVDAVTAQKALLKRGIDPVDKSRYAKIQKRQKQMTAGLAVDSRYRFSTLAAEFLLHVEKTLKPATATKYRSSLNVHLLPAVGGSDIRYYDIREHEKIIVGIKSKSAGGNAHRTARAMFSFAVDKGLISSNPLLGRKSLVKRTAVAPRTRYLSPAELHQFLNGIDAQNLEADVVTALRLQLLTGLRIGEILALNWSDIDFKGRTAKHADVTMKNNQPAETVLSDAARRLLLEFKRETASRKSDRVFADGMDTANIVDELRPVQNWLTFGTHDIRRTVRTYMQELGCPDEIRRAISNHTQPAGVAAHYDHSKMQAAQLHWLTLWADKLEQVKIDANALKTGIAVDDSDALLAEFGDVL